MRKTKGNTMARFALGIALFTQLGLAQPAEATKGQIGYFEGQCPTGWKEYKPLEGRVPVGAGKYIGENDQKEAAEYKVGDKGGEMRHKLTVQEMPQHHHGNGIMGILPQYGGGRRGNVVDYVGNNTPTYTNSNTSSVGGDLPHNNMPPYLVLTPCVQVADNVVPPEEKIRHLENAIEILSVEKSNNKNDDQEKKENVNSADSKELKKLRKKIRYLKKIVFQSSGFPAARGGVTFFGKVGDSFPDRAAGGPHKVPERQRGHFVGQSEAKTFWG